MLRRPAALLVSVLLSVSLLGAAPAGATAPAAPAGHAAAKVAKPATPSKKCKARHKKPRKAVGSKRFARCAVAAMRKGTTVQVRGTFDDGRWNKGPARFRKAGTDASVVYSEGAKLVVIGTNVWHKEAGKPWVKGKKGGTADEQLAWMVGQVWLASSSLKAYRGYLRSSNNGWTWTGRTRKLNGVRAKEYVGNPKLMGHRPDRYAVWLDKWDRPVRVDSRLTIGGITSTARQDFSKWGKKVTIKAPRVS
ncbi:hypothetical protein [Mumia quercus]|uniref:hypothetical protein n=1 Tax=Mumia quercus TaxID=2976125 RepID=UPI0021D29B42|nr:hypothetical protein [Mumia quercus]